MLSYRKFAVAILVGIAFFMESLDLTILNSALPKLSILLNADLPLIKSAMTSYVFALALFLPLSGWAADQWGSKKVFCLALLSFGLVSAFCGLANNIIELSLFRFLQGVAGAFMMPVGRLLIIKHYARKDLLTATSLVAIVSLVGPALGPVLGGYLVEYQSWRWIFLINVPICVIAGIAGMQGIHSLDNDIQRHRFDWFGFTLFGLAFAAPCVALEVAAYENIPNQFILVLLAVGLVLFSCYLYRARLIKWTVVDLSVFTIRTFRISAIGNFLSRIGISSIFFLAPLLFQDGLGKTPLEAGMLFLPYALAMFPVRFFVTPLVNKLGFRRILVWNTFILGILIASLGLVQVHTSTIILVLGMIAIGALTSLQYGCLSVITYIDLPSNAKSSGATVASICQQLSIELGIGLATLVFVLLSPDMMPQHFSIASFKQSIVVMGSITAFASFIFTGLWTTDGVEVVDNEPISSIKSSEDYKIAQ